MIKSAPPKPAGQAWENEGGSLRPENESEALGIVTHQSQTYTVGEYRYTSLSDAMAQGRRMLKAGGRS